jgi:hypothetical protein
MTTQLHLHSPLSIDQLIAVSWSTSRWIVRRVPAASGGLVGPQLSCWLKA